MTDIQSQVLRFIREWQRIERRSPTMHEIARRFGWRSRNSARKHFAKLVESGHLEKTDRGGISFKDPKLKWKPFVAPVISMGRCYLPRNAFPKAIEG